MDLYEIIQTLHDERARLDRVIRRIQELHQPSSAPRKPRFPSRSDRARPTPRRRKPQPPTS